LAPRNTKKSTFWREKGGQKKGATAPSREKKKEKKPHGEGIPTGKKQP